ncbi:leucine-rich repeat-containing protein 37A3-like isoform X3 [Sorex fumeus]|uniref:leucine-rich repeat-containing protein 37A3-like isoform X3 n=1 Tax=Sorex fumeus TaxID=62283 RepID=UPI0024AE5B52|nr:leucine-rich repeat-containing protein 37A3-like isoform X3 [Sorex fumeus]
MQEDYFDSSMDTFYPEGSQPLVGDSEKHPQIRHETGSFSPQPQHPETFEELEQLPFKALEAELSASTQQSPAALLGSPEESKPLVVSDSDLLSSTPEKGDTASVLPETLVQPTLASEERGSSVPQEVEAQPLESGQSLKKVEPISSLVHEVSTWPREPWPRELVGKPSDHPEYVSSPSKNEAQPFNVPSARETLADMTIDMFAEVSNERQPSPEQQEVSAQTPNEATPQPETSTTYHSSLTHSSALPAVRHASEKAHVDFPEQLEQNVSMTFNICELCTCTDKTLSCSGLSPEKRLHRVPVPGPNTNTFTVLDFQGNSISSIDGNTWKAYPWVEKLILSDNSLAELRKDSFEALPNLKYLILSHNPLTTIEDFYLFKLPALKYLDMGATQVPLAAVQNILMMNLKLEKLILPNHLTCCLCQFKNNIDVVYKTVKLRCDSECLISTHCDEEEYISNMDGEFMKALLARKKSTSTELTIEPEKASSERNSLSLFQHEHLDNSHQRDMLTRLESIMSLLQVGDIDAESTLLSFIKFLFKDVQDGGNPLAPSKTSTAWISIQPESNSEIYNKVKKIHVLQSLINTEIQEKIHKVRKKEKIATQVRSSLFGPKFKRQLFPKILETVGPPKKKHLGNVQEWETQPLQGSSMFRDPQGQQKRHFKEEGTPLSQRRGKAWSAAGNIAQERRQGQLAPERPKDFILAGRPRKLVESSFNEESSFIQEHRAPASVPLEQHSMGSLSAAAAFQVPPEDEIPSKDLKRTLRVLEDAGARVRNMKVPSPGPLTGKNYLFRKLYSQLGRRIPQARVNTATKEAAPQRPVLARRPPFGAVKSLVNSPPRGGSLSWRHQDKPVTEPFLSLRSSREKKTAESTRAPNGGDARSIVPPEKTAGIQSTAPEEEEGTEDSLMPAVRQPNEMQWEYHKVATDIDSPPQKPDPRDELEMQLIQKLRPLIPNSNVRKFIAQVIRTLKMDCSDPRVQLECAKVVHKTGLLMKLLSERQDVKVSSEKWDTDQWEAENYINENTEGQGEQKQAEASELIKVPGYVVYHNQKAVVAINVAVVVILLVLILCLIEIYSCRARQCKDGRSRELRKVLKTAARTPEEKAAKETKTAKTPKTQGAQGTQAPQRSPPPIVPLARQTSEPPHGSLEPQNAESPHSIGSSQPVAARQSVKTLQTPHVQQIFRSQEILSSPEISDQTDE